MKFISFDCATKTFAFCYGEINIEKKIINNYIEEVDRQILYIQSIQSIQNIQNIQNIQSIILSCISCIENIKNGIKNCIQLYDGETVDLFPGISDEKIDIVNRIKKLVSYINTRIPYISSDVKIFIEFQMGQNPKARAIVPALITYFHNNEIIMVNPSLKNKIYMTDKGRYCYFIEKYSSNYSANKIHCKYNFEKIEEYFYSKIPYSTKSMRGHIADSFMQVLGYLIYKN